MKSFQDLQIEIGRWSDSTFGILKPKPKIHHLVKEVNELLEKPYSIEEYSDCFILLMDAARVCGYDMNCLAVSIEAKLEINKGRKWGKPDENGVVEHVPAPADKERGEA